MGDMCGTCKAVDSILVVAAGAALAGFSLGFDRYAVAGGLLVLVGLGRLLHVGGMCPMCKGKHK